MFKQHYKLFLEANLGVQHYAAHSHHYWPDVTKQAMIDYWNDSAKLIDDKWSYFFSEKVPHVQKLIAGHLNLSNPEQIVFAPNTHEFILRLISCFEGRQSVRVLTTDSEFHSFERQINRLSETSAVKVDKVSTQPFIDFEDRFAKKAKSGDYDLVFLSQVFFNSGVAILDLKKLVDATSDKTMFVVDGYHGFMALPTDLRELENRIFYISGAYKYAQGGEGCCFMHVPKSSQHRPVNTGWFAGFSELSIKSAQVNYAENGYRFAGSTMDYSALYRLLSVLELFQQEQLSVDRIHKHILALQKNFRNYLATNNFKFLNENNIVRNDFNHHGHFYAFELHDATIVKRLHDELKQQKVWTDFRGTRLRFGFGLYQEDCINLNGIKSI
jgi:selenocysteine lyase/cysteine desulfurase